MREIEMLSKTAIMAIVVLLSTVNLEAGLMLSLLRSLMEDQMGDGCAGC